MRLVRAVAAAPPVRDFYFTPSRATALGLSGVVRELKSRGISCRSFNFPRLNPRGSTLPLPPEYDYLRPYLIEGERGPLSFFNSRKLYGPDFSEASSLIVKENPDIIFLSLFAWTYGDDVIALARSLREDQDFPYPIVLGGAGAAVLPDYFRQTGLFDLVLIGESETSLPDLLDFLESDEPLKDFKEQVTLTKTPAPLVSFNQDSRGNQFLTMTLSRGCPKMCRFCSNFLTQGRQFRLVDLDQMEEKLKSLSITNRKPIHINLEDDNLLYHKNYFADFLNRIKKIFPQATFSAENGLDYTLLDEEYMEFLLDIGFKSFSFSIGSADEATLKREQRPADLAKLERLLGLLEKRFVDVTTFFIAGLPDDKSETITDTLIYLHNLPTRIGISLFYPVPGLPRFEDHQPFLKNPPSLCSGSSAFPWGKSLTTAQMITAFRLARLSNLIKKTEKTLQEKELIHRILQTGVLQTFIGKRKRIAALEALDNSMVDKYLKNLTN